MIKDRLHELKVHYQNDHRPENFTSKKKLSSNDPISSILDEADRTRNIIEDIKTDTDKLRKLYTIILTWASDNEKTENEIRTVVNQIQNNARLVHNKLQVMKSAVEDMADSNTPLARIRRTQYETIKRLFVEVFQNYNDVLTKHHAKYSHLIQQELEICDHSFTPNELEELIQSGSVAVFIDNYVADTREAQLTLNDIKSRHEQLKKVEKDIEDVRDMFLQLALLVENQGESLNCIEYHMNNAEKDADKGNVQLQKAKRNKRRRKTRCTLIIILAVIILILLVAVLSVY